MGESKMAVCAASIMVGSTILAAAVWSNPVSPAAAAQGFDKTPCLSLRGGCRVVFTYMGPGKPPLFPNYDFLKAISDHVCVEKIFHECNYLQANEGNIDPVHLSFLHRFLENRDEQYRGVRGADESH